MADNEAPLWLQFPSDMHVNGDMTPNAWALNVSPGFVTLWIRHPLWILAQPFPVDMARSLGHQLLQSADQADRALVEVHVPLLGPNGEVLRPHG